MKEKANKYLPVLAPMREVQVVPGGKTHSEFTNHLVNLAMRGVYPLFDERWIREGLTSSEVIYHFTKKQQKRVNAIFDQLDRHQSFERKHMVIVSLLNEDRILFIQAFYHMVEKNYLDKGPEIH